MKKLLTIILCLCMLLSLAACGKKQGPQGEPGKDGITPTIEISDDGYWVVNGVKTEHTALGTDGAPGTQGAPGYTPTIEISSDGYWVIDGVKTNLKAEAISSTPEMSEGLEFYIKDDDTYLVKVGDARYLGKIIIPPTYLGKSVTEIGYAGFCYHNRLTEIIIPNSITSIGDYAFTECENLTSIIIPDSVTAIGALAFSGCSSLTTIYYRGTEEQWNAISKSDWWDYGFGDQGMEDYTIIYSYND